MKKLVLYILVAVSVLFSIKTEAFSQIQEKKVPTVIVLSDTGHRNGTTYLVSSASSDIFASDIINELNKTGHVKAPLLGENMSKITQRNIPLYYMTFFNDYRYNFNVDFVNLKRVTAGIEGDYILLVTSGLDIQSSFLKDTWWNKFGIAGIDPVNPTYKLTTLLTLIDKKTNAVVWQDMYLKDISAKNYDLGFAQFAPSYAQLAKIKKYSKNISVYVSDIVASKVNKNYKTQNKPKKFEFKKRFINEDKKIYYPVIHGDVLKKDSQKQQDLMLNKQDTQNGLNIHNINNIETKEQSKQNLQNINTIKTQPTNYIEKNEQKLTKPVNNSEKNTNTPDKKTENNHQNIEEPKLQLPEYNWNLKNVNK